MLYLGDVTSRIHRIDMVAGRVEPPIDDSSVLPMSLAADCDRNRIWAISPLPRGRGLRAVAFDIGSGKQTGEVAIPIPCFATSAVVAGDELFVGGECVEGAVGDGYVVPGAAAYYSDKRIGVRVSLASGERRAGFVPFETSCIGGGACVGGSIAAFGESWIASLPVSAQVGLYSAGGELTRTIPVGSPAFVRDGSRLPTTASSEVRVRWSARNSLIHRAWVIANRLVVAHYLTDLPPGWKMDGPGRPQFKARMNILTIDGKPLHVDIALPELPVGHDDEGLYVVDYGPQGRQGAHESVTVLRVTVPL
jgi:hypothetical protein